MSIEPPVVLSQNITLLYTSLDLQDIDSSELKGLMGAEAKAMVMDVPDMIVTVYPATPLIIQIGDRRIRITFQRESNDIGPVPLWEVALKCHQLVPQFQLAAYGFNYDLGVLATDGNAQTIALDLFVPDRRMLEDIFEGQLLSFVPRLKFKRDRAVYDTPECSLRRQRAAFSGSA
jgi:hypothetical protein